MNRKAKRADSKTLRIIETVQVEFVRDTSGTSQSRTNEAKNLIVQMIELSQKRGRPSKDRKEIKDAA